MKWVLKLLVVLTALWSGYWYLGFAAQKQLYSGLLETGRSQGWLAESQDISVAGYPDRFDTTLTAFHFQTPDQRWGWSGDAFEIKALSYKLNQLVLTWPGAQTVQTPDGNITIDAELLLARIAVSPAANMPLSRVQIEGETINITAPSGWAATIASLNAAMVQDQTTPTRYRLDIDILDTTLPTSLISMVTDGATLPALVEQIRLSALLDFNLEIDRNAFSDPGSPAPLRAIIEPSLIRWGDAELTVEGELSAANNGYIEGRISFDVSNWPELFEAFKAMSNLSATQLIRLKRALDAASSQDRLRFTLQFENGQTRIGPFTIGPAPVYPF